MAISDLPIQQSDYTKANNSFSGSDIKGVFGGKSFAELQAISYAITREKAPIYTMGQVDPRSFSRNKRAIAGTIIFVSFDRNALLEHFRENGGKFWADRDEIRPNYEDPDLIAGTINIPGSQLLSSPGGVDLSTAANEQEIDITQVTDDVELAVPWYSDQVMPFDVVLAANNEYGASSELRILGVEILNEGLGISVDDTVLESQSTFIARQLLPWRMIRRAGTFENASDRNAATAVEGA